MTFKGQLPLAAIAAPASRRGALQNGLLIGLPLFLMLTLWVWAPAAWSQAPAAPAVSGAAKPAATAAAVPAKESRPLWQQLTAEQQTALEPLKSEWRLMDTSRKQTWLQMATRLPSLSPEERARVQKRMAEWVALSPRERGQARIQFQEARRLAPGGRQEHWEAYQALPQEQRRALAAQAAAAPKRASPITTAQARESAAFSTSSLKPTTQTKRNIMGVPAANAAPKLVAPTVVQSRQGATTSLITTQARPPVFHQAGLPKVNAVAGFVDPATLLPLRGPQGAAATPLGQSAESAVPATVDD